MNFIKNFFRVIAKIILVAAILVATIVAAVFGSAWEKDLSFSSTIFASPKIFPYQPNLSSIGKSKNNSGVKPKTGSIFPVSASSADGAVGNNDTGTLNYTAADVVAAINGIRTKRGLNALAVNPFLQKAAETKASHLLACDCLRHTEPDGTAPWTLITRAGYNYLTAGENLADSFLDITSLTTAWMNSPGHRSNILNNSWMDTGVGIVLTPSRTVIVQEFGSPAPLNPPPGLEASASPAVVVSTSTGAVSTSTPP